MSVRGLRLSGFPGWVVWLFVHVAFLNGFGNRLAALWRWSRSMLGRARPERVFSVGHTGGDLSLPDEVKARIMPSAFPVFEADLTLLDRVGRTARPPGPRPRGDRGRARTRSGVTGSTGPCMARPTTFLG